MITRISKIARLPTAIREQLNRRLHDGELGRTILKWLNNLPETKQILTELFAGKTITHQNLSEWRNRGYQDWLQHQQRLEWLDRFTEQETELEKHDTCGDTYEAFSRLFLVEIGQAFSVISNIKNPDDRFARLQNLIREFSRLQNAYNWSRRVQLEWDKWNAPFEAADESQDQIPESPAEEIEECHEPLEELEPFEEPEPLGEPEPELPDPSASCPPEEPQSLTELEPPTGQPGEPEFHENPIAFQPIPGSSPATPSTTYSQNRSLPLPGWNSQPPKSKNHNSPPIRGRRFLCVEG
jgi:hypothetical protein